MTQCSVCYNQILVCYKLRFQKNQEKKNPNFSKHPKTLKSIENSQSYVEITVTDDSLLIFNYFFKSWTATIRFGAGSGSVGHLRLAEIKIPARMS